MAKYDPHLHNIDDDDMYEESEGLMDPYSGIQNNIFKQSGMSSDYSYNDSRLSYNRYYDDATRGDISR